MIKIKKWEIPTDLFAQYVKLIKATERSSKRYNYDMDNERRIVHTKIIKYVGLMPHTQEYLIFDKALHRLCEDMLPDRFIPQQITKLKSPINRLIGD